MGTAAFKTWDAVKDGDPLDAAPALMGLARHLPLHSVVKVVPMFTRNGHDNNLGAFPPAWLARGVSKLQSNVNKVVYAVDKARPYVQPPSIQGVAPVAKAPQYEPPAKPAVPTWAIYGGVAVGAYFLVKFLRRRSS